MRLLVTWNTAASTKKIIILNREKQFGLLTMRVKKHVPPVVNMGDNGKFQGRKDWSGKYSVLWNSLLRGIDKQAPTKSWGWCSTKNQSSWEFRPFMRRRTVNVFRPFLIGRTIRNGLNRTGMQSTKYKNLSPALQWIWGDLSQTVGFATSTARPICAPLKTICCCLLLPLLN